MNIVKDKRLKIKLFHDIDELFVDNNSNMNRTEQMIQQNWTFHDIDELFIDM